MLNRGSSVIGGGCVNDSVRLELREDLANPGLISYISRVIRQAMLVMIANR